MFKDKEIMNKLNISRQDVRTIVFFVVKVVLRCFWEKIHDN